MSEIGKVRLIAAIGPHNELAYVGDPAIPHGMLWNVPSDMEYFHEQTKKFGGDLLVGAGTQAVIGRPLEGRHTYVLSHILSSLPGVTVIPELEPFLEAQRQAGRDTWVGGGQSVYEQTLPAADELWITRINGPLKREANRWFPKFLHIFKLAEQSELHSENGFTYQYEIYKPLQD